MQKVSVEVKSDNKVLDTIVVEQFDTLEEAVSFYESRLEPDEQGKGEGAKSILALINAQHKAKQANAKRVELTREVSPLTQLKARIKTDPTAKERFAALLKEFGIEGELVAKGSKESE